MWWVKEGGVDVHVSDKMFRVNFFGGWGDGTSTNAVAFFCSAVPLQGYNLYIQACSVAIFCFIHGR